MSLAVSMLTEGWICPDSHAEAMLSQGWVCFDVQPLAIPTDIVCPLEGTIRKANLEGIWVSVCPLDGTVDC